MLLEDRPEATSRNGGFEVKRGGGVCGPPLTQVRGWRGDQLMLQAGRGGGLESGWVLVGSWRAPKIMGACPHFVGGLVISSFSSLQLRVDVFKIRSR